MFSFLQVCKFTDLQVHNFMDCPYFYGLSVKISDYTSYTWYRPPSSVDSSQLSVRVLSRVVGSIVGFGEGLTVEFGSILCVSPLALALHTVCCLHNSTLHSYRLHYTYLSVPNCYMRCCYSFYLRNIVPSCGHWGFQTQNYYQSSAPPVLQCLQCLRWVVGYSHATYLYRYVRFYYFYPCFFSHFPSFLYCLCINESCHC